MSQLPVADRDDARSGCYAREYGQFSVNRQRTDANYFTVDGVSANFGTNTGLNSAGVTFGGTLPALTSGGGTNACFR